jgi:hypothetical protein
VKIQHVVLDLVLWYAKNLLNKWEEVFTFGGIPSSID